MRSYAAIIACCARSYRGCLDVGASPEGWRPKTIYPSGRLVQDNIQPVVANEIIQSVSTFHECAQELVAFDLLK